MFNVNIRNLNIVVFFKFNCYCFFGVEYYVFDFLFNSEKMMVCLFLEYI